MDHFPDDLKKMLSDTDYQEMFKSVKETGCYNAVQLYDLILATAYLYAMEKNESMPPFFNNYLEILYDKKLAVRLTELQVSYLIYNLDRKKQEFFKSRSPNLMFM